MAVSKVYVKFPKVGLGNMLLVWARAAVFARLNNLSYGTSCWWGFHWGALFRREKKKRLYKNYFTETPYRRRLFLQFNSTFGNVSKDPPVEKIVNRGNSNHDVYLFTRVLTGTDVFGDIRNHKSLIKEELYRLLSPSIKKRLSRYPTPLVGVHIRRGDFKLGNQTTPLSYFVQSINVVRRALKRDVPVTVFTDAFPHELDDLLKLPDVNIAEDKPDIMDILLLSKSKIMILSRSSTFGYWAAFLSDAIVIRPFNDWQPVIKMRGDSYMEINWNYEEEGAEGNLFRTISECANCLKIELPE